MASCGGLATRLPKASECREPHLRRNNLAQICFLRLWLGRVAASVDYSGRRSVATTRAEILRALAGLLFVAAFPNRGFALDPSKPFGSYLQTHFTPDEGGLPSGIVDSIVQSRDGFLWLIVNGRGLVRFDGQHFTSF